MTAISSETDSPLDWTPPRRLDRIGYCVGDAGSAGRRIIAVDAGGPAGRPDVAIDGFDTPEFVVRGASVRGIAHLTTRKPRQDAYSIVNASRGLIVTVCDGVGSFGLSHEAADFVVRELPAAVLDGDPAQPDWPAIFDDLSERLSQLRGALIAGADVTDANNLGTTVLAASIVQSEHPDFRANLAWLGDSPAYLGRNGDWTRLGGPKAVADGDFIAHSSTKGLPSIDSTPSAETINLVAGDLLVLTSDGIGDPMGGGGGLVGGALLDWWNEPPEPLDFAAHVGFKRRGFTDDRTAVAVWFSRAVDESAQSLMIESSEDGP